MPIPETFTIETENLKLRIPKPEDIPYVFSASRYEGFTDGMLWEPPKSLDELLAPLANSIKAWEQGNGYGFTIENKKSEAFLGRISIRKTSQIRRWNVGFWTHPEHQGKGIMTEALKAIIDFGFSKLDALEIEACHALWNKASEKVLTKNGMSFLRYLEKGFQKKGVWVSENLLEIKRADWLKLNNTPH